MSIFKLIAGLASSFGSRRMGGGLSPAGGTRWRTGGGGTGTASVASDTRTDGAALDVRTQQAITEQLSYVEFLQRLIEAEVERRTQKQLALRLRRASVDLAKTLEGFDFAFSTRINRQQIFDLATCPFVEKHESLLIQGPTDPATYCSTSLSL